MIIPSNFKFFTIYKFFKKNMFARMILFYSCFSVALIILSSFILINWSSRNLEKEINKSNMLVLNQFKIYSDTYLLERLNTIILDKALESSSDKSVYNFFTNLKQSNLKLTLDAWNSISSIVSSFNFIDSIYIYRGIDSTLVSSREGIVYNMDQQDNINRRYINYKTLATAYGSNIINGWISPHENMDFYNNKSILSYYYNFPILTGDGNYQCTILINIDEVRFFNSVLGTYDSNYSELMILDAYGRLLAHSNQEQLMDESVLPADIMKSIFSEYSGFLVNNSGRASTAFTWTKSSSNDWKYVSTISTDTLNNEVRIAIRLGFIMIIFIILVCIIGLTFISSKLYKPVKNLIQSIHSHFYSSDSDGDISLIQNFITNLSDQVKSMEEIIEKNSPIIRYKLILDIIQGNVKDNDEIKKRLDLIEADFNFKYYSLMITEIMPADFEMLPFDQREYLVAHIDEIIDSILKAKTNIITICHPAHCLISIVNYQEFEPVRKDLNTLIKRIIDDLGMLVNISLSYPDNTLLNFNKAYDVTSAQLKYGFLLGRGNVFSQNTLYNTEKTRIDFTAHDIKHLESLMLSNKITSLKEEIESLIVQCKEPIIELSYIIKVIEQITDVILDTSMQAGLDLMEIAEVKSIDFLKDFANIDEWKEWIFQLVDSYSIYVAKKHATINHNYIESIMDYVRSNIEQQLSLNSVAEEFKITANYLSRIFKESTGINFSDFISETKFLRAKELLTINEKKKVSDIAECLGFVNLGYFSRLFKERFGITPLQYRKLYLTGENVNSSTVNSHTSD